MEPEECPEYAIRMTAKCERECRKSSKRMDRNLHESIEPEPPLGLDPPPRRRA